MEKTEEKKPLYNIGDEVYILYKSELNCDKITGVEVKYELVPISTDGEAVYHKDSTGMESNYTHKYAPYYVYEIGGYTRVKESKIAKTKGELIEKIFFS